MPDERLRFTADATLGGADRMLLDDKALLAVLALDDARRAIAEIGIDVAIPQVEWFEDVAVGVYDVGRHGASASLPERSAPYHPSTAGR